MNINKQQLQEIQERSDNQCELCRSDNDLAAFLVTPKEGSDIADYAFLCATCRQQIEQADNLDSHHWHCLNDSMWSEVSAVKVLAWRLLKRLQAAGGPSDLLDMMYLTDEESTWAQSGFSIATSSEEDEEKHRDSNGDELQDGDDVYLIKDLKVKGGGFTAKQGTKVKGISLVANNIEHIEGRVEGQRIVILTEFVKKQ